MNKDIIMTSKKLEQVETEANFPRIGRGMKPNTWIPRAARGKIINPLELSYIDHPNFRLDGCQIFRFYFDFQAFAVTSQQNIQKIVDHLVYSL